MDNIVKPVNSKVNVRLEPDLTSDIIAIIDKPQGVIITLPANLDSPIPPPESLIDDRYGYWMRMFLYETYKHGWVFSRFIMST